MTLKPSPDDRPEDGIDVDWVQMEDLSDGPSGALFAAVGFIGAVLIVTLALAMIYGASR